MTTNSAIYCRISDDRDMTGLGVERQERLCKELVEREGWIVGEVFVDNDISAFSGKKRPAYLEMLRRTKEGEFGAIVSYAQDRLQRDVIELETFMTLLNDKKAVLLTVTGGFIDFSSPDSRTTLRVLGSFARGESEKTSARIKAKAYDKALKGEPWKTGNRPFGYKKDFVEIEVIEANAIKEIVPRLLAGESLNSVARWLNSSGYKTTAGKPFRRKALQDILKNPRYAGKRAYYGVIVADAIWPAIISEQEFSAMKAMFDNRKRESPVARSFFLTGVVKCAECGKKLVSGKKGEVKRYRCMKDCVSGFGCGGVFITARNIEELVTDALLTRLNSPELDRSMKASKNNPNNLAIHAELNELAKRNILLSEMFGAGELSRAELQAAKKIVEEKKVTLEKIINKERRAVFTDSGLATPEIIVQKWKSLNLDRQRAILKAVIEEIHVSRNMVKSTAFNPARVKITWKF